MKKNAFFITLLASALFVGCNKSADTNRISNQPLLDSIVFGSASLHFIYDDQNRVIKERLVNYDTLREENIYSYYGNDSLPYMKTHNGEFLYANHISHFEYVNGNKVHDSTYFFLNNNSIVVDINYSIPGKTCVLQRTNLNLRSDTLYLNSNNNIDSIRVHSNITQPYGPLLYIGSIRFSAYNAVPNYFRLLSISKCNFYNPEQYYNYGTNVKSYIHYSSILELDFYNSNYYTSYAVSSIFLTPPGGLMYNTSRQIQFNSTNQPVSEILAINGSNYPEARFIYR